MSKKPLTRAELKKLEQLKKQLELKESKLNTREQKLKKRAKDLESAERQLATDKKQFHNEKKQFKSDKEFAEKNASKNLTPSNNKRPFSAQKARKLKEDYAALKKKHEHFAKLMRQYKQKSDQLEVNNKVLRSKLKNASKQKLPTTDKQLRSLMKENKWLKKKLRELMKELRKQKRWYSRVVKVFKDNNNKWVQKKIEAYADKQYIIKYVFVDDIKRITLTRPGHDRNGFKPRVRIKNGRGGQVVLRNVGIDVFDQKVRKRDRKGKRDRRGGGGGRGRGDRDIITKQRPGKDGKNIIKTKYVDKGDTDTITKEKAGKKGDKKGGKNNNNNDDGNGSKSPRKGGKGGKGGKSPGGDDDDDDDSNNKNKKKKKRSGSKADAATSEFLVAEPKSPAAGSGSDGDDNNNNDGDDDDDYDDIDEDDFDTLDDPEDVLDDYMVEFLKECGLPGVTKDNMDAKMDELDGGKKKGKGAGSGGDDDDDDGADTDADDAKLDAEFQDALKSDKDLMFDEDSGGSEELQAQIMYLLGEMDSRNNDLNTLQQVANGVQFVSKPDATGNEEQMEEKQLPTLKDKMDAMALVFAGIQERQDKLIANMEELNVDTEAFRPVSEMWADQYNALTKMALTGGSDDKAKKQVEKLRYFIDYFMKELRGRMYDLRCINAAYYNKCIDFDESGAPKDTNDDDDDDDDDSKKDDKPVFDTLQSDIDGRHGELHDVVSKDEVMNSDNTEDAVAAGIEEVLNDFLGNIDDWKSLIQESRTKHETWIDSRGKLLNAMIIRHTEIGELIDQVNSVPSYTMNLQKWSPNNDDDDADGSGGDDTDTAANSGVDESGDD